MEAKHETRGYIRKSCDTITTPPSNSLIALARASMDCMSKWLVGSSIIDVSRWQQSRIRGRTEEEDMRVLHRQRSEDDAKRERMSSVHVARREGKDKSAYGSRVADEGKKWKKGTGVEDEVSTRHRGERKREMTK
jgi:hypothetical protein